MKERDTVKKEEWEKESMGRDRSWDRAGIWEMAGLAHQRGSAWEVDAEMKRWVGRREWELVG